MFKTNRERSNNGGSTGRNGRTVSRNNGPTVSRNNGNGNGGSNANNENSENTDNADNTGNAGSNEFEETINLEDLTIGQRANADLYNHESAFLENEGSIRSRGDAFGSSTDGRYYINGDYSDAKGN